MSVFTSQLQLNASTSGHLQLQASATTTSYTLTMPPADGTTGQVLTTDGNGVLSWSSGSGGGGAGVSSFSAGATGLEPAAASAGDIVLSGTLVINNGGTGGTNRNQALNNLLPIQTNVPTGYILATDGTDAFWEENTGGVIPQEQQEFDAPGTYTVPTGVTEVRISAVGGGGGGGNGGGGGGGGQVHEDEFTVTPGASIPITVGNGGAAGNSNGGQGGSSSFGTFVTVTGGTGGGAQGPPSNNYAGNGGPGGTPDGTPGQPGGANQGGTGMGGLGGTGDLSGHGNGGNGAASGAGQIGQAGLVIVKWGTVT